MDTGLQVNYPSFLPVFNQARILLEDFEEFSNINLMKIRPRAVDFFHTDGQTWGI
jgi:hypothetical protein